MKPIDISRHHWNTTNSTHLAKMAAPPPRKFGEKIALLKQREADGSAAFEKVMADVKKITTQVCRTVDMRL